VNQELLREDRLAFWDRLIHGESVEFEELDQLVTKLAHDASDEDRINSVLLLAAAQIARVGRRAMRRNLVAALRYWFSHVGTKDRPSKFDPRKIENCGLIDIMGLYLTWPEALASVLAAKSRTADYTALKRIERCLEEEYMKEWERLFGSSAPYTTTHGR